MYIYTFTSIHIYNNTDVLVQAYIYEHTHTSI